jgi:hypothetical protein
MLPRSITFDSLSPNAAHNPSLIRVGLSYMLRCRGIWLVCLSLNRQGLTGVGTALACSTKPLQRRNEGR